MKIDNVVSAVVLVRARTSTSRGESVMRSSTSVAQAVAAVLSGWGFPTMAAAWAAQSESPIIEEVIVTVERIEQNLQSYEGTAVVMQQAQLDAVGASKLVDLPALMAGGAVTN